MSGRITLHVDTGTTWGGGQQRVWMLVNALHEAGEAPVLVAQAASPLAVRAAATPWTTIALPMRGDLNPRASWQLAQIARRANAVLLHAHTAHAHALLLPVARVLRRPLVVTRRNLADPAGVRPYTRVLDAAFTRLKYDAAAAVFCVSDAVADDVARLGVPRERLVLARTPARDATLVPPDARLACRQRYAPDGGPLLVALGALEPVKNHAALVRVAAALSSRWPTLRVAIAGVGSQRAALERLAADCELAGRLAFCGHLDDPRALLAAADIVVHPSLREGMPGALVDALAQRCAVVATRVGGVPELLEPDRGLVVPPGNDAALRDACARLLDDPAAARALGERGGAFVLTHYTLAALLAVTRATYDRVLASP